MRVFKRWTSGVVASFDWIANQVENHEALVASAIQEMQDAAAKARAQTARVQRDGEALQQQLERSKEDVERWSVRAQKSADADEAKALECVRRKRHAEKEVAYYQSKLKAHLQLERQLRQDLEILQTRLAELKRKKNTFLARKYHGEAQKAGTLEHVGLMHEIDDLFERWEMRLSQCEPLAETLDSFAAEFEEDEERDSLLEELQKIKDQ